ncbi:MAG TPA: methyltransferase domain-containing protein [Solirubrobacterales bacterium]|jgi:trans-aconitate 2-methyltransferase
MSSPETSHTGPREWDAEVYHRVSESQFRWGLEVLDRLPLAGNEVVLDAGCGSGRVTEALVERLPDGRVIAVDGSEEMVRKAREVLGPRADVRHVDLERLELDERVDAIFSNAVFHWIKDHRNLFARLRAVLAPGGRLVAQCGGRGNVAALAEVILSVAREGEYGRHLAAVPKAWNFRSDEETTPILEEVGFTDVRCWLEPKEVRPEEPLAFLRTVSLGPYMRVLPEELRDPFVSEVLERMGDPLVLDYVRLNIAATAE